MKLEKTPFSLHKDNKANSEINNHHSSKTTKNNENNDTNNSNNNINRTGTANTDTNDSNKDLIENKIPCVLRNKTKRKSRNKSIKPIAAKLFQNNKTKTKQLHYEINIDEINTNFDNNTKMTVKPLFKDECEIEFKDNNENNCINNNVLENTNCKIENSNNNFNINITNTNSNYNKETVTKIKDLSLDLDNDDEAKDDFDDVNIPTFNKLKINETTEENPNYYISQDKKRNVEDIFKSESTEEYDYSLDTEEFRFNKVVKMQNKTKEASTGMIKKDSSNTLTNIILNKNCIIKTRNTHTESKLLSLINEIHKNKEKTIDHSEKASTPCSLRDRNNITYFSKHSIQTNQTQIVEENSIVELDGDSPQSNNKESIEVMGMINKINKTNYLNPKINNISQINESNKDSNFNSLGTIFNNKNIKEYYPRNNKKINIKIQTDSNTPNKNEFNSNTNYSNITSKHLNFTTEKENTANIPLSSSKNSRRSSRQNFTNENYSSAFTPTKTNQFISVNNQNNSKLNIGILGLYPNNNKIFCKNNTSSIGNSIDTLNKINSNNSQSITNNNTNFNTISYSNNNFSNNNKNINNPKINNNNMYNNPLNHPNSHSIKGINKPNISFPNNYFFSNQKNMNAMFNTNNTYSTAYNTINHTNNNNHHHQSNYSSSTHHSSNQVLNNQFLHNTTTMTNNTNNTNNLISSNQGSLSLYQESELFPTENHNNRQYPSKIPTEESMQSLNSYNPHLNDLQSPTNITGTNCYSHMFNRMEFNKNFSSSFTNGNMPSPFNMNLFSKSNINHIAKTANTNTNPLAGNIGNVNINNKQNNNINANNNNLNNMTNMNGLSSLNNNLFKMNRAMVKPTFITSSSCYNNSGIMNPATPNKNPIREFTDFEVRLEEIAAGKESRSTLMIKNVPNKYTLENALNEINEKGFKHKFQFFYLPPDLEVSYFI